MLGIDALPAVGLEEVVSQAALLDRVDVKYVVAVDCFAALVERLAATHAVLEREGDHAFPYRTTYFDTADLVTYRAHLQRRRRRYKCRTREYVDSGIVAFEVKLKGARGRTVKHRMPYERAWRDDVTPSAAAFVRETVEHAYGHEPVGRLQPSLAVTYNRITLVTRDERLTCDFDVRFRAPDGAERPARERDGDRGEQVAARRRARRPRAARARGPAGPDLLQVLPRRRLHPPGRQEQPSAAAAAPALRVDHDHDRGGPPMKRAHVLAVLATAAIAALPSVAGGDARSASVIVGTDGRDVLRGTGGADTIRAMEKDDRVRGRGGNDRIDGGSGEDVVSGGSGRDRIYARTGKDRVNGGAGNDRIFGSTGGDRLTGGSGRDRISGGKDDDVIDARDGQRDSISCGTGKPDRVIADSLRPRGGRLREREPLRVANGAFVWRLIARHGIARWAGPRGFS